MCKRIFSILFFLSHLFCKGQVPYCYYLNNALIGLSIDSIGNNLPPFTITVFKQTDSGYEEISCVKGFSKLENGKFELTYINHLNQLDENIQINVNDLHFIKITRPNLNDNNKSQQNATLKSIGIIGLKYIKHIQISNFSCPNCLKKINIQDINILKNLPIDSLESISIDSYNVLVGPLFYKSKHIKYLNIPFEYFNPKILEKDSFMFLRAYKPMYYFSNNLVNATIRNTKMLENETDEYNFPQNYFFIKQGHQIKKYLYHEIIAQNISKLISERKTGEITKYGKDLGVTILGNNNYFNDYSDSIIFKGTFTDGLKTGKWIFKPSINAKFFYEIDFQKPKTKTFFPENGKWTYYYPNGQTAIEGDFKKGKKDGEWKFYYPNGKPASIKYFSNDLPKNNWTYYNWQGEVLGKEFYFSEYDYIREERNVKLNTYSHIKNFSYSGYNSTENGDIIKVINGYTTEIAKYGSKKQKKIIKQNFLKYLYATQ